MAHATSSPSLAGRCAWRTHSDAQPVLQLTDDWLSPVELRQPSPASGPPGAAADLQRPGLAAVPPEAAKLAWPDPTGDRSIVRKERRCANPVRHDSCRVGPGELCGLAPPIRWPSRRPTRDGCPPSEEEHLTRSSGMRTTQNGSRILVGRRLGTCFPVPEAFASPGPTPQKLCRTGSALCRFPQSFPLFFLHSHSLSTLGKMRRKKK